MYAPIDKVQRGIHHYAESEVAPKATGLTKFGVFMVLPSVHKFVADFAEKWKNNPMTSDLFNEAGDIDLDMLKERAMHAMEHCPYLEVAGFKFDSSDIEAMYNCILRA